MTEYGRIVGQSSGATGRGGGSGDVTGQVMDAITNVVDEIASQPPEILIGLGIVAVVLLVIFFRR